MHLPLLLQSREIWVGIEIRQKGEEIRLWNRLINMPEGRLTKKVFNWDKAHNGPWMKEVFSILREADLAYAFPNRLCCNINMLKQNILKSKREMVKRHGLSQNLDHMSRLSSVLVLSTMSSPF